MIIIRGVILHSSNIIAYNTKKIHLTNNYFMIYFLHCLLSKIIHALHLPKKRRYKYTSVYIQCPMPPMIWKKNGLKKIKLQ